MMINHLVACFFLTTSLLLPIQEIKIHIPIQVGTNGVEDHIKLGCILDVISRKVLGAHEFVGTIFQAFLFLAL